MAVERLPKTRIEANVEKLSSEKTYWQDLGRRLSGLRDGARALYSFQNPFNERTVTSSDEASLSAQATREASNQEHSFVVRQIAQADRFISRPLAEDYRAEAGTYTFGVGTDEVSIQWLIMTYLA
jgi:flagellar hook-associated protein 2